MTKKTVGISVHRGATRLGAARRVELDKKVAGGRGHG